jgi:hypothetical protein
MNLLRADIDRVSLFVDLSCYSSRRPNRIDQRPQANRADYAAQDAITMTDRQCECRHAEQRTGRRQIYALAIPQFVGGVCDLSRPADIHRLAAAAA